MIVSTFYWAGERGIVFNGKKNTNPDIVFYFFDKGLNEKISCYETIKNTFPNATLIGNSTSGPIFEDDIFLGSITGAAISFDKSTFKTLEIPCKKPSQSYRAGKTITESLPHKNLRHIFVITDGMNVNGDKLVAGINETIPDNVSVSGGLASDGFAFSQTLTGINSPPTPGNICVLALYGDDLIISTAAEGGWVKFGKEFIATKSNGTNLYTLDNKPVLEIYRDYLGPDAEDLPSSALFFPIAIKQTCKDTYYIRTVNNLDDENNLLNFTGEIPEGSTVQFMKGSFKELTTGALKSAKDAKVKTKKGNALVLAVSCLGRQLLMGQKIGDELEAVKSVYPDIPIVGFYSNGEISYDKTAKTCLHNETMTITVIGEK